jgi:hypothetical protein
MDTLQIDILNPKAEKLIKNLAELNLISIRKSSGDDFLKVVRKIRKGAKENSLTLEEITKEVEFVRTKRYERKKG